MMKLPCFVIASLFLSPIVTWAQAYEWKEIASEDGITIHSRTADCSDPANGIFNDYLLLKVVNGNDQAVTVSFDRRAWFDDRCKGCETQSAEHRTVILLDSNTHQEGTCASREKTLKVFSKTHDLPNVAKLTRFEVGHLSITRKTSAE